MRQIILASHGYLADGMKNTVGVLTGNTQQITSLCAYCDDVDDIEERARKILDDFSGEEVFVITDVFGGSVNSIFVKLLNEYGFWLISGMNLALVVQILLMGEDVTEESIKSTIETTKNGILLCNGLFE